MSKWEEKRLGEVCAKITKGTTPTTLGSSFVNSGINFIKSESINNSKFLDRGKYAFIDEVTYHKLNRSKIKINDILFSMAGMFLGKTAVVQKKDVPANTNQAVAIIRICEQYADYNYIYYYLSQKHMTDYINLSTAQSAQPNINLAQIGKLPIKLPQFSTQKKISDILSSYDDLIENNNQRIELLEKTAQNLYKEWFIRFRFPNYKKTKFENGLPQGWKIVKFGDVVEIIDGDRGSNYPKQEEFSEEGYCLFLNTGNVTKTGFDFSNNNFINKEKDEKLRKGKLQRNDIVITTRGTVGNVALYSESIKYKDIRINSGMVVIREKISNIPVAFLYALLRSENMKKSIALYSSGSAQPQLPIKDMRKIKFILPSNNLINDYSYKSNKINLLVSNFQAKNRNLIKQRDLLLPRLMSGKLDL